MRASITYPNKHETLSQWLIKGGVFEREDSWRRVI